MDKGKPVTVVLDFDGVIHTYEGWNGPEAKGGLIRGVHTALMKLKQSGARVEIFSTRPKENIRTFIEENGLDSLIDEIRDGKPYYVAFFDDRAHNVPCNKPWGLYESVMDFLYGEGNWVDDSARVFER